ncbi:MAG: agmatine deiminase family protein [Deltaproteobacteria bacterium]|nr:agmatine deiminase family protein [Deltaproteobacteria bacterium]
MTEKPLSDCRLPAEWEPQDGILLAWPHADSDWQPLLKEITAVYIELTRTILQYQAVLIATPEPETVKQQLAQATIDMTAVRIEDVPTNDTWTRDFGPITVLRETKPLLLDFEFNGWGAKFAADRDNQVTKRLHTAGSFGTTPRKAINLILEGGSIESDGAGTILTTSKCLLNSNRNHHLDKKQIEQLLFRYLGAKQILWLDHGFLAGDDTDAHIDTLARLGPNDTITYVRCNDPQDEHYAELLKMEEQLQQLKTQTGAPFRLIPLPWPQARHADNGDRLPATYANYLVINGAVLVPSYADPADRVARTAIAAVYPDRDIISIDCRPVVRQYGSLHCLTMQLPEGVLS